MAGLELMMIFAIGQSGGRQKIRCGFTLIELILVMTLLSIVATFIAPSLGNFMRGRALDSEARRLLSMMHSAQSMAISEGMPMLVRIDSEKHEYGIRKEFVSRTGEEENKDEDDNRVFEVDENVHMDVKDAGMKQVAIRFLPDETIDEGSQYEIKLSDSTGAILKLVPTKDRNSYEIVQGDE